MPRPLPQSFYARESLEVACDLLGKLLVHGPVQLRITEVNPMLFPDLVFERFIDVSRADLPDIDLHERLARLG